MNRRNFIQASLAFGALIMLPVRAVINRFYGHIAEAAVWDCVLTDAELNLLSKGMSPLYVRPENLAHYVSPRVEMTDG